MYLAALEPRLWEALDRIIAPAGLVGRWRDALRRALGRWISCALQDPAWPIVGFPWSLLKEEAADPDRIATLLVGCLAYFGGLDALDDVQDQQVVGPKWQGHTPAEVINLGGAMQLASLRAFGMAGCHLAVLEEVLRCGLETYAGQAWDLGCGATTWMQLSEEAYLELAALKAGRTLEVAGLAAHALLDRAFSPDLRAWARDLGTYLQLFGDLAELEGAATSPDLAQGKANLSLLHFWATQEDDREAMLASLASYRAGEGGHAVMRLLHASGSLTYARLRLHAERDRLMAGIETIMPPAQAKALADLIPGRSVPI